MGIHEINRTVFKVAFALLIALIVMTSMIDIGYKKFHPETKGFYDSDKVTITNEEILGISVGDFDLNLYLPVIHIAQ